jgi:hypothetical protein
MCASLTSTLGVVNTEFGNAPTMNTKQYEGGCLCGAVRFRATGVPGKPHTCSCETCRRHSGSLTISWVEFPADSVEWSGLAGKPATWRSSSYSSRAFCSSCGSTIGAVDDEPTIALVTGAFVKFRFSPNYFVDTIKYAHMGRTKAQAEHQESRA